MSSTITNNQQSEILTRLRIGARKEVVLLRRLLPVELLSLARSLLWNLLRLLGLHHLLLLLLLHHLSDLSLLHLHLLLRSQVLLLLLLLLLLRLLHLLGHLALLLLLLLQLQHQVVLHLAVRFDLLFPLGADLQLRVRVQEVRQLVVLKRVVQELLALLLRLLVSRLGRRQILRRRRLVGLLLGHLRLHLRVRRKHQASLLLGLSHVHRHVLGQDLRLHSRPLSHLGLLHERLRGLWLLGQSSGLARRCLLDFPLFVPSQFVGILALLFLDVFLDTTFNILLEFAALAHSQHVQFELKHLA